MVIVSKDTVLCCLSHGCKNSINMDYPLIGADVWELLCVQRSYNSRSQNVPYANSFTCSIKTSQLIEISEKIM